MQSLALRRETGMQERSELRRELDCMLHFHESCFPPFCSLCILEPYSRILEFSLVNYLLRFQYKTGMPSLLYFKLGLVFCFSFGYLNLNFPNGKDYSFLSFN